MAENSYNPPILYKLTSNEQIQEWQISVSNNIIKREYGLQNGKKQVNNEVIKVGKNIGRSNETTPEQQAKCEAEAEWNKKLAKDYFLDVEHARVQQHRLAKEGGYLPMLAQEYKKHAGKYLKFPCYVQPKLDGIRCIATKYDGQVDLWFRSGKAIRTLPHINEQLVEIMHDGEIFDGELYTHGEDFNDITGAIRSGKCLDDNIVKNIQYWIYDAPIIYIYDEKTPFTTRFKELLTRYFSYNLNNIQFTDTLIVNNHDEAMEFYGKFIYQGFEGIMFRNFNMPYEQRRSYNLLKYKEFIEDEFPIVDYVEGNGNLVGHVGSFVCSTKSGALFNAKLKGSTKYLKELFENPEQFKGKSLTVKYFELSKDGIPRFPTGKCVRFDK